MDAPAIARLLRAGMRERGLDALLVTHLPHLRLLTGFSGSNGQALLRSRSLVFQTDERYREQAAAELQRARVPVTRIRVSSGISMTQDLAASGALAGIAVLGFEEATMSVGQHRNLRKLAPGLRLRPAGGLLESAAARKDAAAIAAIRRAVRATDAVFAELPELLRPGLRECDLAAEISFRHRRHGADGDSFPPIVLFGSRSSLVHGQPSRRALRAGDTILLDIGCVVDGYCSDMTRVVALGAASPAARSLHAAVREAQEAAIAALLPGARYADVDAAARSALDRHGLARCFTHGLGHGVGLEIHERPRLAMNSPDIVEEGNVVTVEPGVYIPDRIGIRCEDMVLIGARGPVLLTRSPRDLLIV